MKRIIFILIGLGLNCAWGATYYSTGDGSWNTAANWSTSSSDPTLHPSMPMDPNSSFWVYNNITFDGWNPTSESWVQIMNTGGCFKTISSYSNANAVIQLSSTGVATGAIDVAGSLSIKSIVGNTGSAISPIIKVTGDVSMQTLATYNNGHTFNFSCQNFTISQNYNYRDGASLYKNMVTNLNITGNASITNLYSAGTLNITKPGAATADLTVSNVYSKTATDFTCSVDGNITVSSTFEAKQKSEFTTGGTMTLSSAGPSNTVAASDFIVNGNLTLNSGLNNNTTGKITAKNGNLTIKDHINSGKIDGATITVNTGNFIMQNGVNSYELAIDNNSGTVNVTGGNMTVGNLKLSNNTASVSVSGNLTTLKAAGIEKNGSTASLTVGGNVTADFFSQNANTGTTSVSGNMVIAGSLNPLSGAITIGGNLTFGTNLMCNNSTTLTVGGNVSTSSTGAGALNLNSSDKLIIGGSFTTGTGNFTFVNNGLVQTGGAITVNNMASGTNNSSGTIISGSDLTFLDTDGSTATNADNPLFRNDGKLVIHGNIKADNVTINSSNGSAMVTYYQNLSEPNSGLILPKDSSHMPIELLSFTGTPTASEVVLKWKTASELNNAYFLVEKSGNGIDFTEVAKIAGAGTSSITNYYQTTDKHPAAGVTYYRLRQVDVNGKEGLSKIISVTFEGVTRSEMLLLPSLARNGEVVQCVFAAAVSSDLEVVDARGVKVLQYSLVEAQTAAINTENLPAGVYFARLVSTGEVVLFTVIGE